MHMVVQEKELSGMKNLLLEQDEDIRACQQRLGELESTLLQALAPSSSTSSTGELAARGDAAVVVPFARPQRFVCRCSGSARS